ncbi:hypothetical protein IFM89_004336 [Coptis chinensis]|uniref:Uncharacterized protein n=1 Tax=Coptis chinensis TaxID=261450 RepID=A0A835I5G4_9MAGN|nr:hypothetical protein IFM89_004336 [Coptis chinensis]
MFLCGWLILGMDFYRGAAQVGQLVSFGVGF